MWVQLRNKRIHKNEVYRLARRLKPLIQRYGAHLIINDHLEVAHELQLGVHLGVDDGDPVQARRLLGPDSIIGITIHNDIERAHRYAGVATYVGVGPVFHTTTKADTKSVLGIEGLEEVLAHSPLPVVAIGGIQMHNIESVIHTKPAHIAVCSAICSASDPLVAWRHLHHRLP